ncbi:MAG: L-asparaginase [Chloroflexota bacterium]|jgi:L-asparaginase|nr:L-asparaginase [Chloroflexota bacterium]
MLIRLLSTGGTISTTTDAATGRSAPTLSAEALSRLLGETAGLPDGLAIAPEAIDNEPSWALDPERMARIARHARDAARDPDVRGVVVTHGTTTLEYTAFLVDLFLDSDTPVVLTGSMRKADAPDADGPANLRDAVRVAASEEARGAGALVVFAGRVIAAGRAWKARRLDPDAFVDLGGDLGRVTNRGVSLRPPQNRIGPLRGDVDPRVAFVKALPGLGPASVAAAVAPATRGIVVEGLPGVGGLPAGMREGLAAAAVEMPVVLASRAPYGRLPETPTGGTGEPLRDAGFLSAAALSAEQAWLLLMAVLAETSTPDEAKARFRALTSGTAGQTA